MYAYSGKKQSIMRVGNELSDSAIRVHTNTVCKRVCRLGLFCTGVFNWHTSTSRVNTVKIYVYIYIKRIVCLSVCLSLSVCRSQCIRTVFKIQSWNFAGRLRNIRTGRTGVNNLGVGRVDPGSWGFGTHIYIYILTLSRVTQGNPVSIPI